MTVGRERSRAALDQWVGNGVVNLKAAVDDVIAIKDFLDRIIIVPAAGINPAVDHLTLTPYMYTEDEADLLRDSYFDLAKGCHVLLGHEAQNGAQPSNYFWKARDLAGQEWKP